MAAPSSKIDVGVIIALVWLMVAVAMTVLYGPELGLRGWLWLGFHHVLIRNWTSGHGELTTAF